MVIDRGAWVAMVMLGSLAAGCESAPLATPHPVDPVTSQQLVIPADVGPPLMRCSDGASYPLTLPCQLGQSPVFETDCAYGPGRAQTLTFMLPASLPDAGGSLVIGPPLGVAERFHALLVPEPPHVSSNGLDYTLQSIDGTVTFTQGSLADRAIDGWFTHLDFVYTSGASSISCAVDKGRFTTVPGGYL
jgi:hypothetical protein